MAELEVGELVLVEPTNRGNGRLVKAIGDPGDIHAMMEAVALDSGVADPEPIEPAIERPRRRPGRTSRSARAAHVHRRSAVGEGLRRRPVGGGRERSHAYPGAHRRRRRPRRGGLATRSGRRGSGDLGVPAGSGRPDAAARSSRTGVCSLVARRRPARADGHARSERRSAGVSAHADPKRSPAHLRAGRRGDRRRRCRDARADRGRPTASAAAEAYRDARRRHGALNLLDLRDGVHVRRRSRSPTRVPDRAATPAHHMIEELMVRANEAVAELLERRKRAGPLSRPRAARPRGG